MTIDYDRLRELVAETEKGLTAPYFWTDLARELVRLRDELTDLRDLMYTHAGHLRKDGHDTAADWTENHAQRLTRIMEGDNE